MALGLNWALQAVLAGLSQAAAARQWLVMSQGHTHTQTPTRLASDAGHQLSGRGTSIWPLHEA